MNVKVNQRRTGVIMNKENIITPERLLVKAFKEGVHSPKCWLLETGEKDCHLHFQCGQESTSLNLSHGWRGILMLNRVNVEVISGAAKQQELPLFALVKLQVFIDESKRLTLKYEQPHHWSLLN